MSAERSLTLQGKFVDLRSLSMDDAERTLRWRQGEKGARMNRGAETVEAQRAWIAARPETEYNFVIENKAKLPIGMLSLVDVSLAHRRAEAARFLIGEPAEAALAPVAVEAMKLLYEFAFMTLKLNRVYGSVVSTNGQLLKWHKYLGMKEEGRLRNHLFFDGQFFDSVCIGMLSEEFQTIALPRMNSIVRMANEGVPNDKP